MRYVSTLAPVKSCSLGNHLFFVEAKPLSAHLACPSRSAKVSLTCDFAVARVLPAIDSPRKEFPETSDLFNGQDFLPGEGVGELHWPLKQHDDLSVDGSLGSIMGRTGRRGIG